MSIKQETTYSVRCDSWPQSRQCHRGTAHGSDEAVCAARSAAYNGWAQRSDGTHVCPACVEMRGGPPANTPLDELRKHHAEALARKLEDRRE